MAVANFRKRLAIGQDTELRVADKLTADGIVVVRPEYPEGMPTSYYTKHQIDLLGNDHILEVKGRNLRFTGVDDYPYDTIFVSAKKAFDGKDRKPDYYLTVANGSLDIIALPVEETISRWTVEVTADHSRNHSYEIYVSTKDLWIGYDEFLRRLKESYDA